MVIELDLIFWNAIRSNAELMSLIGNRLYLTCIETPPTQKDNTPCPYIIVMDDPFSNDASTKDTIWESSRDIVKASIEISGKSTKEVRNIRRLVRKAVAAYISKMEGKNIPYLVSLSNDGLTWDWMKPCYYDTLHYSCDIANGIMDDEGSES